jgi:hypothetical protein
MASCSFVRRKLSVDGKGVDRLHHLCRVAREVEHVAGTAAEGHHCDLNGNSLDAPPSTFSRADFSSPSPEAPIEPLRSRQSISQPGASSAKG